MESLSKAHLKLIQSLHHKKFRLKYNKFIVEGLKITRELLLEKRYRVEEVYVSNPDYLPLLREVEGNHELIIVPPQQMHQLSQMTTPPGVLAVVNMGAEESIPNELNGKRAFYLDSIRDPGNLGTILRTADWFGLDYVLLSPDCVDVYNHKVLQASMGSALRVKTLMLEKVDLFSLSSDHLYVCDASGICIDTVKPPKEGIFVLGNESLGVSDEIMHKVRQIYSIPGHEGKGAESLNVGSAAAVIGFWLGK